MNIVILYLETVSLILPLFKVHLTHLFWMCVIYCYPIIKRELVNKPTTNSVFSLFVLYLMWMPMHVG